MPDYQTVELESQLLFTHLAQGKESRVGQAHVGLFERYARRLSLHSFFVLKRIYV